MSLTITRLKSLKPKARPYKVTDGRGLYIEITPSGVKLSRFRYRLGKSQKKICIGSFPEISLAEARDIAFEAKRKVARGDDPDLENASRRSGMSTSPRTLSRQWRANTSKR